MTIPIQPKRGMATIDLTGDNEYDASRPTKTQKFTNASSSQAPPRSQASQLRYEDDGEYELIDEMDASQNYSSSYTNYELYGTMQAKIVGARFYNGHVTTGEMVSLVRQPHNQYDKNAIKVDNVRGEQIGHISRQNAAKLAPFLDAGTLLAEAATTGPKDYFEVPLAIKLYGTNDRQQRELLKLKMENAKLPTDEIKRKDREEKAKEKARLAAEKEKKKLLKAAKMGGMSMPNGAGGEIPEGLGIYAGGFAEGDGTQSLDAIMTISERFNPRNVDDAAEQFGFKEDDLAKMDMAEQPHAMQTKMLPYQLQGLKWLLQKENPTIPPVGSQDVVQMWKRDGRDPKMLTNIATNFTQLNPELASGGILADDMGLGKTIQFISLIMADREAKVQSKAGVSGATLILAPLSVMSNWSTQFEKHVKPSHALRILIYHGTKRPLLDPKTITNYDIIITTYDTVMSEYWGGGGKTGKAATAASVPRKNGLFSITFRRLLLDEGHQIRNPATKKAGATCNLLAQSRWVLTGTPIVNNLKDLYSLVRFVRLTGGLEHYNFFNSALIRPVSQGSEHGHRLLQVLMRDICLRRKKEMAFIDLKLPELSEYVHKITLSPQEQEKYDLLDAEAKGSLETYRAQQKQAGVNASKAYRNLLEILLRMRQTCNHWKLCGEKRFEGLKLEGQMVLDLSPENKKALQEMLQLNIDAQDDCPVCMEPLVRDPVITACTHSFCYACIEKVIETQQKCPMCRAELNSIAKLVRPAVEASASPAFDVNESSSKVEALLAILNASNKKQDGSKTIVFSQWTSFLNVIEAQLKTQGHKYTRIDGSMPAHVRDAALDSLENDADCTVMLASLSVCSVGLNLVAANQVILADTWWAPAIEDQAVDRVHRLGQKRPTTVFRLVIENSIEETVLKIQEEKRKLMSLAFAERESKRGKGKESSSVANIERLLGAGGRQEQRSVVP